LDPSFSWLPALCQQFEDFITPVWEDRSAIAHGDYYIHNILLQDGVVYPIDWEFAGIDLPEIDLACLTDGISANTTRECERAYRQARWPGGAPDEFEQTLGAARLCLYFHNLGARPHWTSEKHGLWYSKQLRSVGEQLGMIG
jgi:thiamine kinase-like enzyme